MQRFWCLRKVKDMSLDAIELFAPVAEHLSLQPEAVVCDRCRSNLEIVSRQVDSYGDVTASVEVCETCLNNASQVSQWP